VSLELSCLHTRIDLLTTHAQHDQPDAAPIEVFDDPQQVGCASGQTVRLGHNERIAFPDEAQSPP
jgi:hypothetical protein